MGGYALANWPATSRQKVRRRASGGKFARGGFTAGCRDRPCVSDHQVWGGVGRRPGIRFIDRLRMVEQDGKDGKDNSVPYNFGCWGGAKDCLVASVDDRVGASSGIPEADPGWQPSHFQLTTTPKRTIGLARRDGRVPEGGSRLWPQLYGEGGGWCQGRGMATDGNVAISGIFPGSSKHLMAYWRRTWKWFTDGTQVAEASVAKRASNDYQTASAPLLSW